MLQINENLSKKLQELETRLTDTNDELKRTKEALEVAKDTIAQCKEENISLENRLSKYHREHVLQADTTSCKQKDVMIVFFNCKFYSLSTQYILFIYFAD